MITINKDIAFKRRLLETCIVQQQALIDDFKGRIRSLLSTDQLGNEDEYESADIAQSTGRADEVTLLNQQLEFANAEMAELDRLKSGLAVCSHAQPGAIVVTNIGNYFISVSIEQFEVDGEEFIGVSTKSPLYMAMKGKGKGERFSSKGIRYQILDII